MAKAQAVGRKQKQLLKKSKGPSTQLTPGKMKSQLQKGRVNKAQMKESNRNVKFLGNRRASRQEAKAREVGVKVQKKDKENADPQIDQPKKASRMMSKKKEIIEDPQEGFTHEHQAC